MEEIKKEKLKKFANDKDLNNAVRELLENSILKPINDKDVHILASERIALNAVREAWKEIEKFRSVDTKGSGKEGNVGL